MAQAARRHGTAHQALCLVALFFIALSASAQSNTASAYTFTTLAGNPLSLSSDGLGPQARFDTPTGMASDGLGNFYLVDSRNYTVRRINAAGVVSTISGVPGVHGDRDGFNGAARLYSPGAIAADGHGNVFVGDYSMIRMISSVGANWQTTTIAGAFGDPRYRDGQDLSSRFVGPRGLAVDSDGTIYVADGPIRKITPQGGHWVVTTVANRQGYTLIFNFTGPDITNRVGLFTGDATAIAVGVHHELFVADEVGKTVSKLTLEGTIWKSTTIAGLQAVAGVNDGPGAIARFNAPTGITTDRLGNVYVADGGHVIRRLTPQGNDWIVSTIAGAWDRTGNVDGLGTNALFRSVVGVASDPANNLLVTDSGNNEIRKVFSSGVVKTLAGSAETRSDGSQDGVSTQAQFNFPAGVAVDDFGNVYVLDTGNSTIRVITPSGIVSTLAGSPLKTGHADGIGSEARFNQPEGIAVDREGNVFVADGPVVRMMTPDTVVSTIAGVADQPGDRDGSGKDARFTAAYDVAVSSAGVVFITDSATRKIRKLVRNGSQWGVSTVATVEGGLTGITLAGDSKLCVLVGDQVRQLNLATGEWVSAKIPPGGSFYHLVADNSGHIFIPTIGSRTILEVTQAGTNWQAVTIGGHFFDSVTDTEGGNNDGAGTEASFKVPYGIALDRSGTLFISDVVNNNIRKGVFTQFVSAQPGTYTPPTRGADLVVTLLPPEAGGRWRFPWELGWRSSGERVTNLVAGNYPIEFRSRPDYLPIPSTVTAALTSGATTFITNRYYPTLSALQSDESGALTVNMGAGAPRGAGWRFLGDGGAFFPSGFTTNLAVDNYLIEFAPVQGRSKPPSQAIQVFAGRPAVLSVNYLLAATPPAGVLLPRPVPLNQLEDESVFPFGFNGQIQSDIGYGSGTAVAPNVVLTVAHLVFNDQTLSYVSRAHWYAQDQTGLLKSQPLPARGYYLLSGYASRRTNDLQSGLYGPDQSTPQSRNLDVAALYFLKPVAGGAYSGYLPSDAVPNPWLSGSALKMLTGYPVDGSQFGDAGIMPGRLYQTEPQPDALSPAPDPVEKQRVYVAPWFLSYPGNSGGALYCQFNGRFYPAGVYLGTLFSGTQPSGSAVRAIDGDVAQLISLATTQGDSGTNNTGGGVITILPSQNIDANNKGYVQWQLGPTAAVKAGAAWRLRGDAAYSSSPSYVRQVSSTNAFAVEFKPIPGWNLPTNQTLLVLPAGPGGQISSNNAVYTLIPPMLVNDPVLGLGILGTPGISYRLEMKHSLSDPRWLPVRTNTISSAGFTVLLPKPAPQITTSVFYRLEWLP